MAREVRQAVELIEAEARWYEGIAGAARAPLAGAETRGRAAGLRSAVRVLRDVEGFEPPPMISLRVERVESLGASVAIVTGESDDGLVRVAVPSFDAPEVGELIVVERYQLLGAARATAA